MGTTGSVRNACLYDSTAPDDDIFLFKLTVYFTQNRIVQNGFYQCVSETVDGGAVESSVAMPKLTKRLKERRLFT